VRSIAVAGVPWNPNELVDAGSDATRLGHRLVVVDDADALRKVPTGADCDVLAVPAMNEEVVAAALAEARVAAVLSLSEPKLHLAARLRALLGLRGSTPDTERALVDKALCREVLAVSGLTGVRFRTARVGQLHAEVTRFGMPAVVKPRALAGSNGVRLVTEPADVDELVGEYDLATAAEFGRDEVLIESVIAGVEISAEALVVDGKVALLALTDKVNTGAPYFAECGHIMPSRHVGLESRVIEYLQRIVNALGVVTAPLHAELMITEEGLELVEVNARFGGGGIVRLMTEHLAVRPFAALFAALLEGRLPKTRPRNQVWGVGFFTARMGSPPPWRSYDFPRPQAVVKIDLDYQREPKLSQFEGIGIRYWRPGHAFFSSPHYDDVRLNVEFMTTQFMEATASAGRNV